MTVSPVPKTSGQSRTVMSPSRGNNPAAPAPATGGVLEFQQVPPPHNANAAPRGGFWNRFFGLS